MQRHILFFIIANFVLLLLWLRNVSQLIGLLLTVPDDVIHLDRTSSVPSQPTIIPRIIHQTSKNETIPQGWLNAQKSCMQLHPDYEYVLWTDEKARDFIAAEYPWFLSTFDGYRYPIQRADVIRYFVLAHYGGVYIDLDDGCNRRLDPLLGYPAWVRRTVPTGISNDVMGSVPQHPFFVRVLETLQHYDRSWLFPYVTVMYSTGPLFLSVIWEQYTSRRPTIENRVHILMPEEYNQQPWAFFNHHRGNSWHESDAPLFLWMGRHCFLLTLCGILLGTCATLALWKGYSRVIRPGLKTFALRFSYRANARPDHYVKSKDEEACGASE